MSLYVCNSLKKRKSSQLVKKRQISSYCRQIWTFSAHLNFVSWFTYSMVLERSSGASSLKKRKSSRLVKKREISSYCRHILTFPAHLNFISWSTSSMVLELIQLSKFNNSATFYNRNRKIFRFWCENGQNHNFRQFGGI